MTLFPRNRKRNCGVQSMTKTYTPAEAIKLCSEFTEIINDLTDTEAGPEKPWCSDCELIYTEIKFIDAIQALCAAREELNAFKAEKERVEQKRKINREEAEKRRRAAEDDFCLYRETYLRPGVAGKKIPSNHD